MRKTLGIFSLLAAIFFLTGLLESNFFSQKSYFFDGGNIYNMAKWTGLFGILAIGVCFVIVTGGIDLSIGSLIGLNVLNRDDNDGVRYTLEDGSWLLIRFSGTEPLLRIYAESRKENAVSLLLEEGRLLAGV